MSNPKSRGSRALPSAAYALLVAMLSYILLLEPLRQCCSFCCPIFIGLFTALAYVTYFGVIRGRLSIPSYLFILLTMAAATQKVFIPSTFLYGYDPIHEFKYFTDVLRYHVPKGFAAGYPGMYVFAAIFTQVLGTSPLTTARYLPIVVTVFTNVVLYLFFRGFLMQEGASVKGLSAVSAMVMIILYQHMMFHAIFIKETYAFLLYSLTAYLIYRLLLVRGTRGAKNALPLIIVMTASIALSHHFTSFIMIMLSVAVLIAYGRRILVSGKRLTLAERDRYAPYFILLIVVVTLIKWAYYALSYSPLIIIKEIIKEITAYSRYGGLRVSIGVMSALSLRQEAVLIGELVFIGLTGAVFVAVLTYLVLRERGSEETGLGLFTLVYSALISALILVTLKTKSLASTTFIRRIEPFAYPYYFVSLTAMLKRGFRYWVRPALVRAVAMVFLFYVVVQAISIQPYLYCMASIEYLNGETRNYMRAEEISSLSYIVGHCGSLECGEAVIITNWNYLSHWIMVYSEENITAITPSTNEQLSKYYERGAVVTLITTDIPNLAALRSQELIMEYLNDADSSRIYSNGVVNAFIKT